MPFTIPSPVPTTYRVNFTYPFGTTVVGFRLYSLQGGAAIQLGATLAPSQRQFGIVANAPLGVQNLVVRAVAPSGTESDDSNAVEVNVTDKPVAPTGVEVIIVG